MGVRCSSAKHISIKQSAFKQAAPRSFHTFALTTRLPPIYSMLPTLSLTPHSNHQGILHLWLD